jgi:hypothetical protein
MPKVCPEDRLGRTFEELVVQATMRLAMKGNATALNVVWDRLDGKLAPLPEEPEAPGHIVLKVQYADEVVRNVNALPAKPIEEEPNES